MYGTIHKAVMLLLYANVDVVVVVATDVVLPSSTSTSADTTTMSLSSVGAQRLVLRALAAPQRSGDLPHKLARIASSALSLALASVLRRMPTTSWTAGGRCPLSVQHTRAKAMRGAGAREHDDVKRAFRALRMANVCECAYAFVCVVFALGGWRCGSETGQCQIE